MKQNDKKKYNLYSTFIAKENQRQATRSQTKLITGSQALADPFLDKYKWSSLTCGSEHRVIIVLNPLHAQTSMFLRCHNIVLWKSLLLCWSSSTCGKVPGMSFAFNVDFLTKSSWTSFSSYPYHLLRRILSSLRSSCKAILRRYSYTKITFTKIETPASLRNVLGEILCWKEWTPFLWMQVLTWPLSFHSVSLR